MLSAFAVRRWQFTLVAFLALAALGVKSLVTIPKAEDPTFPFATFAIVAVLPGSTPTDVERLVVDPLETKLKALDDVKTIKTEVEEGLAVVQIEFVAGVDPDRKRDEVLRETTALRPTLPADLARLDVKQFNAAKVNIVEVALASEHATYAELDVVARGLKRRLENVPGVGEVEIAGLPSQEVTVVLDLERMVALGVSPQELLGAVGQSSANVPAGGLDSGARRFNVKTSGDYASIDEIRDTEKYPGLVVVAKPDITDCLVAMQQGEADATTGDDTVLAGFAAQDPSTEVVGPTFTAEPYGLGMNAADVEASPVLDVGELDVAGSSRD